MNQSGLHYQAGECLRVFVRSQTDHTFWSDEVSLLDKQLFDLKTTQGHREITDLYLLGLCHRKKGTLATFDQRIAGHAVRGAAGDIVEVIE